MRNMDRITQNTLSNLLIVWHDKNTPFETISCVLNSRAELNSACQT